jgi:hypothetical protein
LRIDGTELLAYISERITKNGKKIRDSELAGELGVTQPALAGYKKNISYRTVYSLMKKYAARAVKRHTEDAITPIVEFYSIERTASTQGKSWQLFPTADKHPYRCGLCDVLDRKTGVYIFYDSRGRAIYVGKAVKQVLWKEMTLAFQRDRGDVQSIMRVQHPLSKKPFGRENEKTRKVTKEKVQLHDIASYFSAYAVTGSLIGTLEALLIRSFANDLLNTKMESFL